MKKILFAAILVLAAAGITIIAQEGGNPPSGSDTSTVKEIKLPRLVELGSVTCKPCKKMEPIIEELRQEYEGRLSVEFIDVKKQPEIGREFKVILIPTQVFIKADGEEFYRHQGFFPRDEIITVLDSMGVK
jgi:thioredoxin 1